MLEEHFGIAPAELVRAGCVVFVPNSGGQVEIVGDHPELGYDSDDDTHLVPVHHSVISNWTEKIKNRPNMLTSDYISSVNYDSDNLIKYWKNNRHVYVCSSKVGSNLIRNFFMDVLNSPCLYEKNSITRSLFEEYASRALWKVKESKKLFSIAIWLEKKFSKIAIRLLEKEKTLKRSVVGLSKNKISSENRKVLFLVRCPFSRVISSYTYLKNRRFDSCKREYLSRGINLDEMNIVEYINFLDQEIGKGEYNEVIEHFFPQKRSFILNAFEGMKISLLWQTEKIKELLDSINKSFDLDLDINKRVNVSISDKNIYYKYYLEFPELFQLVRSVFKEDLDWLNPIFDYENKFGKNLLTFGEGIT